MDWTCLQSQQKKIFKKNIYISFLLSVPMLLEGPKPKLASGNFKSSRPKKAIAHHFPRLAANFRISRKPRKLAVYCTHTRVNRTAAAGGYMAHSTCEY